MISKSMVAALNSQIKHELYSSYLYLSMAAFCESENLHGFAKWLRMQSDEERGHGMKFYEYLLANGEKVALDVLEKPPLEFGSMEKLFEKVLDHEQKITGLIHKLYAQATEEKDYRTQIMLQWFVTEQMEEEENASAILARIKQVDGKMSALLWIDKEVGKRG